MISLPSSSAGKQQNLPKPLGKGPTASSKQQPLLMSGSVRSETITSGNSGIVPTFKAVSAMPSSGKNNSLMNIPGMGVMKMTLNANRSSNSALAHNALTLRAQAPFKTATNLKRPQLVSQSQPTSTRSNPVLSNIRLLQTAPSLEDLADPGKLQSCIQNSLVDFGRLVDCDNMSNLSLWLKKRDNSSSLPSSDKPEQSKETKKRTKPALPSNNNGSEIKRPNPSKKCKSASVTRSDAGIPPSAQPSDTTPRQESSSADCQRAIIEEKITTTTLADDFNGKSPVKKDEDRQQEDDAAAAAVTNEFTFVLEKLANGQVNLDDGSNGAATLSTPAASIAVTTTPSALDVVGGKQQFYQSMAAMSLRSPIMNDSNSLQQRDAINNFGMVASRVSSEDPVCFGQGNSLILPSLAESKVAVSAERPPYSYASLIAQALLDAPAKRLTLHQIYAWIMAKFAYFRNQSNAAWQNSIRHNLSLNKCFVKLQKTQEDRTKGAYWELDLSQMGDFKDGMFHRKRLIKSHIPTGNGGMSCFDAETASSMAGIFPDERKKGPNAGRFDIFTFDMNSHSIVEQGVHTAKMTNDGLATNSKAAINAAQMSRGDNRLDQGARTGNIARGIDEFAPNRAARFVQSDNGVDIAERASANQYNSDGSFATLNSGDGSNLANNLSGANCDGMEKYFESSMQPQGIFDLDEFLNYSVDELARVFPLPQGNSCLVPSNFPTSNVPTGIDAMRLEGGGSADNSLQQQSWYFQTPMSDASGLGGYELAMLDNFGFDLLTSPSSFDMNSMISSNFNNQFVSGNDNYFGMFGNNAALRMPNKWHSPADHSVAAAMDSNNAKLDNNSMTKNAANLMLQNDLSPLATGNGDFTDAYWTHRLAQI